MIRKAAQKIRDLYSQLIGYLGRGAGGVALQPGSPRKTRLPRPVRVLLEATRGFQANNCTLHASALTFYSILSIVPVLAMAFGIAKGFGFERLLERRLMEELYGQQEVLSWLITFANRMLENTRGGLVAGFGVAALFWSVVKVLGHIEASFNAIWRVRETRGYWRKFSDYQAIMLISPLLMIMSSSATVFINTQVTNITERVALLGYFSGVIFLGLKILPFFLIWILFSFLYILIPNTRVKFGAGILGGVIAGTLFQLSQVAYIEFQVGVARHNAIYGSFTALPLFLIWLQISWLIVLLGAQIAFAQQNLENCEAERQWNHLSPYRLRLLTLEAARLMVRRFAAGDPPLTRTELVRQLSLPPDLVGRILRNLLESGTFSETRGPKSKEPAFQPARDIHLLTIAYLVEALDKRGGPLPAEGAAADEKDGVAKSLAAFQKELEASPANILLKDL
ncbi:MAG: YihY/virulence factor BrkB family protein [Desulfobacteraceae bacterium]|nr:YihY/virulence factor BrkB family protein [Desulfobacteraceae bacterium]